MAQKFKNENIGKMAQIFNNINGEKNGTKIQKNGTEIQQIIAEKWYQNSKNGTEIQLKMAKMVLKFNKK